MSITIKECLSAIAISITLVAFFPYIRDTLRGSVRPHMFSWIVWGTTTAVVFFAQLHEGAGAGAWPIGVSACITIYVALLAFLKRADVSITRMDWVLFLSAMSSLPFWYFTDDPLWAVLILTLVDVLGFGPTFRKAYVHPYSESLLFFGLFTIRDMFVILALENYSITTLLFPATISTTCALFIAMVIYRRRTIDRQTMVS